LFLLKRAHYWDTRLYRDISTPSLPNLLSSYSPPYEAIITVTLSPDEKTAFLLVSALDNNGMAEGCALNVIDISVLFAPAFISSMSLSVGCTKTAAPALISTASNSQILLIPLNSNLAVVDVSTLTSPILIDYESQISPVSLTSQSILTSSDYNTLFFENVLSITIADLKPENILYLEPNNLPLGASYSSTLNLLTKNSNSTF
jgi:hypothetical protein